MSDFNKVFRRKSGDMSVEESAEFDAELTKNKDLAGEYSHQNREDKLLSFLAAEEFGDYIQSLSHEDLEKSSAVETNISKPQTSTAKRVRMRKIVFAAAASVLLCIAAFGIYFFNKPTKSALAAQKLYELPKLNLEGERSKGEFNKNVVLLNSGDKNKVKKATEYFKTQTLDLPQYYLIGHGEYILGNYEESHIAFKNYIGLLNVTGATLYIQQVDYYYVVSLIADGKYEAARAELSNIREGHPYAKYLPKVNRTLDQLEK